MKYRARQLRKNMTDAERALWQYLRMRNMANFKFRRQVPLGSYIVDFASFDAQLVVEVDGGQHAQQTAYDQRRTDWLCQQGFQVVRFWDHEVLGQMEEVKKVIWDRLPPTLTLPHKGGGDLNPYKNLE